MSIPRIVFATSFATLLEVCFLASLLLALVGCHEKPQEVLPDDSEIAPLVEAPPDPAFSSYAIPLSNASLRMTALIHPDRPFPREALIGSETLDLVYEGESHSETRRVYGNMDLSASENPSSFRLELNGDREARRGDRVFRIAGRVLSVTNEDDDAIGDSVSPRRWECDVPLVAGPLVFEDYVLVATARPSFVALDRSTLDFVFERPVLALASGSLLVLEAPRSLVAFHADGTVGCYSLEPESSASEQADGPDIVDAILDPSPSALASMETKTASLAGIASAFHFGPVIPYGFRNTTSSDGISFFRVDADEAGGSMRLYVDGVSDRPYLVAAFDGDGSFLKSNIDYMGAERVLEMKFAPSAVYFFAVGFLDEKAVAAAEGGGRFVVARK